MPLGNSSLRGLADPAFLAYRAGDQNGLVFEHVGDHLQGEWLAPQNEGEGGFRPDHMRDPVHRVGCGMCVTQSQIDIGLHDGFGIGHAEFVILRNDRLDHPQQNMLAHHRGLVQTDEAANRHTGQQPERRDGSGQALPQRGVIEQRGRSGRDTDHDHRQAGQAHQSGRLGQRQDGGQRHAIGIPRKARHHHAAQQLG